MDKLLLLAMNGLIWGLIFGAICGPIFGLFLGLSAGLSYGLSYALMGGLLGALICGLLGGGDVVLKHLLLRTALRLQGHIPGNYAHFLDYAANRFFLHTVGGGYIFAHRLIMEHFAALTAEDIQRLADPSHTGTEGAGQRVQ